MAMEFDKEMDALLKRMSASGERPGGRAEPHLDAEEIAAFAENAVPGTARTKFITHFADCGRCRTILADTIALNAAEPAAAALPATASAGAAVVATPWYKKLFALQSLAYGMAGLIVIFGGLIAYTALFSSQDAGMEVSQAPREENVAAAVAPEAPSVSMAESAANIAAPSQAGPEEKPGGPLTSALDQTERDIASARSQRGPNADRQDVRSAEPFSGLEQQKESIPTGRGIRPAVAPPAPPPPSAMPTTTAESVVAEAAPTSTADAATREQLLARQQAANVSTNVQNQSGPSFRNERAQRDEDRAQVGALSESQKARMAERQAAKRSAPRDDAPARRNISGKSFELRDGVWFDSAYSGQATENIRRGTEGYRKLDSGLRSIAQRFREPVVAVWKGKAYRIQ